MRTKFIIALSIMLVLTGCGTTSRSKMATVDLDHYVIDCSKRDEQTTFLKTQLSTQSDRVANLFQMTSLTGWANAAHQGSFTEDYNQFKGTQDSIVKMLLQQIRWSCYDSREPDHIQGCTHLDESMPSGSSNGARCYTQGAKRPTITRWEATVGQ